MKNYFTPDFYKFLLGFSVIILAGFSMLVYLGTHTEPENIPESATLEATPTR